MCIGVKLLSENRLRRRSCVTKVRVSALYMYLDLDRLDRWGPSSSPKRGRIPQFSAHVYCGQTAAWINMPLGTDVGLGPDDIVLDADPATTSPKGSGAPSPIFGPCLLWPRSPISATAELLLIFVFCRDILYLHPLDWFRSLVV